MSISRSSARLKEKSLSNVGNKRLLEVSTSHSSSNVGSRILTRVYARGLQGRLQTMCVMPLDIWLEIFRYLRPVDLLQISRSCKMCREMLLDPSATSAWRAAFNNLDHPPLLYLQT
ncbi:hypothetical protein FPV67DRAFT_1671119 [Lyophyllum atratum]|nr:hypothetical protein FPV67DRAFT_1671119 [Lyophyllum atratum]